MRREHLLHLLVELAERFGRSEFYVIGSSAILASIPDSADATLLQSRDADIVPTDEDEGLIDQISWVLGEGSDFEVRHGYYAQGVSGRTAQYAPTDWRSRTIPLSVAGYRAHCMEPHDLLLAKLGAGRQKDLEFARAAVKALPIRREILLRRLTEVAADAQTLVLIEARVRGLFA